MNLKPLKLIYIAARFFIASGQKAENVRRVLISTIRPHSNQIIIELIFAILIRKAGHDAHMLIDVNALSHHDSDHRFSVQKIAKKKFHFLAIKKYVYITILRVIACCFRIKLHILDGQLKNEDLLTTKDFDHIKSSCKRYCSSPAFLKNLDQQSYFKQSLKNASILKANIVAMQAENNFDCVLSSHGIYVTWGIIHDYLAEVGCETRVYLNCIYSRGSMWITREASQKIYLEDNTCSEKSKVLASKILDERTHYDSNDNKIYFSAQRQAVKRKTSKKFTLALFPNIIWDGAISERDRIFSGVVDWIVQTINIVRKADVELIIRFHPAEATLTKWAENLQNIIFEEVPDLYDIKNVTIIGSDENIELYEMINRDVDLCILYDGILALESTHLDVPVLNAGVARYSRAGFVFDAKDMSEYEAFIKNPTSIINEFERGKNQYKG